MMSGSLVVRKASFARANPVSGLHARRTVKLDAAIASGLLVAALAQTTRAAGRMFRPGGGFDSAVPVDRRDRGIALPGDAAAETLRRGREAEPIRS